MRLRISSCWIGGTLQHTSFLPPFSSSRVPFPSLSLDTPSCFSSGCCVLFSESPFEEVGHANVGGRVSGRPRASATTTSPRYQGQNTGRRMSLLFSANEEVASHSANIMKAPPFLRYASRKRSSVSVSPLALPVSDSRSFNSPFTMTRLKHHCDLV